MLRADVDSPPDWRRHRDVLVDDVGDEAAACVAWVCFDVDALKRILHLDIPKGDIPDTPKTLRRRHRAYGHANSQPHRNILHQKVLGAVSVNIRFAARLRHDHIVPVLHSKVVDVHVGSVWVDTVSVEREHRDDALKGETLQEVDLGSGVDFYVQAVDYGFWAVVQLKVELWGVLQGQGVDRTVAAAP